MALVIGVPWPAFELAAGSLQAAPDPMPGIQATIQTIDLWSGNTGTPLAIGASVPTMTLIKNGRAFDPLKEAPFDAADFSAAATSSLHPVVVKRWVSWVTPGDNRERWIGAGLAPDSSAVGASVLYHTTFNVTVHPIDHVQLYCRFAVDDRLGDWDPGVPGSYNPAGVYINGQPVVAIRGGGWDREESFTVDVTPYVSEGVNHLYFYQRDWFGAPSALAFVAQLRAWQKPPPGVDLSISDIRVAGEDCASGPCANVEHNSLCLTIAVANGGSDPYPAGSIDLRYKLDNAAWQPYQTVTSAGIPAGGSATFQLQTNQYAYYNDPTSGTVSAELIAAGDVDASNNAKLNVVYPILYPWWCTSGKNGSGGGPDARENVQTKRHLIASSLLDGGVLRLDTAGIPSLTFVTTGVRPEAAVFDVQGQRVATLPVRTTGGNQGIVVWSGAGRAASGVYWLRIQQGAQVLVRSVVVLN